MNRWRAQFAVRGFTLIELVVMILIFAIFSTALIATLSLCLGYWGKTKNQALAQQNAWLAMSTITAEFRQAIPVPPAVTSILSPTTAQGATGSNILTFTEPAPSYAPTAPAYETVNFTVETPAGGLPSLTRWTGSGTHVPVIAAANPATASNPTPLSVQFVYRGTQSVDITVTCQEGDEPPYALTTTATTLFQ